MARLGFEVVDFIVAHVDDVESLELMLLLHRKQAPWTAEEAASELGLEPALASDRLVHLTAIGLLSAEPGERFTWRPRSADLARVVADLAAAYRSSRAVVLDEIARGGTLRTFSDAFRVRGKKDDDG